MILIVEHVLCVATRLHILPHLVFLPFIFHIESCDCRGILRMILQIELASVIIVHAICLHDRCSLFKGDLLVLL